MFRALYWVIPDWNDFVPCGTISNPLYWSSWPPLGWQCLGQCGPLCVLSVSTSQSLQLPPPWSSWWCSCPPSPRQPSRRRSVSSTREKYNLTCYRTTKVWHERSIRGVGIRRNEKTKKDPSIFLKHLVNVGAVGSPLKMTYINKCNEICSAFLTVNSYLY